MFAQVKTTVRQDASAILFFAVLAFGGFSIWYNAGQGERNARELLDFADASAPKLRTRFSAISNKTLLAENKPESYTDVMNDLNELSKEVSSLQTSIPRKNNDPDSQELQNNLNTMLNTIGLDVTSMQGRLRLQQDLLPATLDYAKLKASVSNGDVAEIRTALEGGKKLLATQQEQAAKLPDGDLKTRQLAAFDTEEKRLNELQKILDQQSGAKLSTQTIIQINTLFENQWPIENAVFPRIRRDEFETQQFAQNVQAVQQAMTKVKQTYNIS